MRINSFEDVLQATIPVSLAKSVLHVSLYLVDGMLIDTGPSRKADLVTSLLSQWEFDQVVLTHHHEDHTGLAPWIEREKRVPIYIHETGIELCEKKAKLPFYRHLFWGKRDAFSPEKLGANVQSNHYMWEVIHTPGHAIDHIALFNREKGWMFGGDLFVQPRPKSMFRFEDVPLLISSLRKVLTYDFTTYFCQHAGIIVDGKKVLKQKLDYLLGMQQEILFRYNEGKSTKQIQQELFPKKHIMNYFSLGESSARHFIHSITHVTSRQSE